MPDLDGDMRKPINQNGVPRRGYSSRSMAGAVIIAILIIIALGYVFLDRSATGPAPISQPAATTTAPAPATTPPASPAATATPPAGPAPATTTPKP